MKLLPDIVLVLDGIGIAIFVAYLVALAVVA